MVHSVIGTFDNNSNIDNMLDLNLFANHIRHRDTLGVVDGLALLPLDRVANFLRLVLANLPRLHPTQIIRHI